MAGLTSTGITIKDVDEVLTDIESEQLASIDANLNVEADSVLGQLNGVVAAAIAEAWELLEEIYHSAYPDTASGQSLSYVSALTGAIRRGATKTEIRAIFIGTVDTVIPAGTQLYPDGDPDSLFALTADATILEQGAVDWVYGDLQAVTAGSATTAAVSDVLVLTGGGISGLDSVSVHAVAPDGGAAGADEETDAELRPRREQMLALAGSCTVEAIRADMLQVAGVDSCTVFENPTGDTDSNGLPPHSIEVLVHSDAAPSYTSQDVVDQIWASKPAGTETYGGLSKTTVDSQGNGHTIKFLETDTVRTYAEVALTAAADGTYIGDSGVADSIEAWALANLTVGRDVFASDIINVVADLVGVVSVDVTATSVDSVTPTVATNLVTTSRQLATIAAGDVTVTS